MKSIFKILVLGVVPVLALTAVVDQGLAADKGSQLIFQSNMAHKSFISVANAHGSKAVTVLVQYYNDAMERVLWYLRVLPADSNVLVDPFDHMIPGTASDDDMDGTNVSEILGALPAMSTDKKAGMNSGHFVIAITAVGASMNVDGAELATQADANAPDKKITDGLDADGTASTTEVDERNQEDTVNVLFPTFLAEDMHKTDNIDNCGSLQIIRGAIAITGTGGGAVPAADNDNLKYTPNGAKGVFDCRADDPKTNDADETDITSKNVGGLNVDNALPVSFNHLTGHFTEALTSTAEGGADQTASWGGTPVVRPAVSNTANGILYLDADMHDHDDDVGTPDVLNAGTDSDYQILNGMDENPGTDGANAGPPTDATGVATGLLNGRLAEKDAGGAEVAIAHTVAGYANRGGNMEADTEADDDTFGTDGAVGGNDDVGKIKDGPRAQRGLNGGALVLPALHGGGDMAKQIMLMLSATDDFGGAGKYSLMAAKTGYMVSLMDTMGDALADPSAAEGPVFGGTDAPESPAGTKIIVDGIRVMVNAGKCGGDMIMGPWTLDHLTSIVPAASSGHKDFAGLDAMMEPMMNASPGWIKFKRTGLECKKDFGDGDSAIDSSIEEADGVPTKDERTYKAGTLVTTEANEDRAFITTGTALLKFITPTSTFAASWSLKSPPSPAN